MINQQATSTPENFFADFAGILNSSGGLTEISEAPMGTSQFSTARYFDNVTPDLLMGLSREKKSFAFIPGVNERPGLRLGEYTNDRSRDIDVQARGLIPLDADIKEMIEGFEKLQPSEKRSIAHSFYQRFYPKIKKHFGDVYLIVFSGNGIHFHLKSRDPVDCSNIGRYKAGYNLLTQRFEEIFEGELVFDRAMGRPAQPIRVPGTVNWKNSNNPVTTEIFHHSPDADSSDQVHAIWEMAEIIDNEMTKLREERKKAPADTHKDAVKNALGFRQVLEHFNYSKPNTIKYSRDRTWFNCSSPFKDPDRTPSCFCYDDDNFFKDFSSGNVGDNLTLIALLGKLDLKKDFKKIMKIAEDLTGIQRPNVIPIKSDTPNVGHKTTSTYEDYCQFFEKHLPGCEKDIFSGALMVKVDGLWQAAVNQIPLLESYAIDSGGFFKKTNISSHLARFSAEQKEPKLLVDIPEWDGVDRIKTIADCFTLKNCTQKVFEDLTKEWGAKMFQRVKNPSIQNKMIILKGPQGIGKDTAIDAMTDHLGQFAFPLHITQDKDLQLSISMGLVMKISEFDRSARIDSGTLKDIITASTTCVRAPYDRAAKLRQVRCSYISSINIDEILRDHTGNRRYVIFEVAGIKREYPLDQSSQILAQFKHLADTGYEAPGESVEIMNRYISDKTPDDPKMLVLADFDDRMMEFEAENPHNDGVFQYRKIKLMLSSLAKDHGVKLRDLQSSLKGNGRSKGSNKGPLYFRESKKPGC